MIRVFSDKYKLRNISLCNFLLGPNILFGIPFLNILSLSSSRQGADQVTHKNTTGSITDIVTCISDFRREFGLANRFIGYSLVETTNNYNTFKITVIIAHK
jgi:hypothetical protein